MAVVAEVGTSRSNDDDFGDLVIQGRLFQGRTRSGGSETDLSRREAALGDG